MKALVILLASATAISAAPTEWMHVQEVDVARSGLIKLSLPAETLDAARPELEDLRIFDSAGHEAPYLVERPVADATLTRNVKDFQVRLDASSTIIIVETGVAQPIDSVTVDTPAQLFLKAVTVEGSTDRVNWSAVATGQPIFRQPNGANQLTISFRNGTFPFLRLTVDDRRSEPIPFTAAQVHAVTGEAAPTEPLSIKVVERMDSGNQTRLTLDLGSRHLTMASLVFETPEQLFTRPVTVASQQVAENAITEHVVAHGTIYRVNVEGFQPAARLVLSIDSFTQGRELILLIDNGDSEPLQIERIQATRRPVYAVFLAQQAGQYQLYTGNSRCAAPRYDVASLSGQLKGAAVTPISPSTLANNASYQPAEPLPEIQDVGTLLDTSAWYYRKSVELKRAGVQQLDLDLDVLSRADPAFRDLRLVRDGKQRPYVLEHASISRNLEPQVVSANDPRKPSMSRWSIKLPRRNLPLTRLTCMTSSTLFRRQALLYEEPTDERGEKYQRVLGSASWVRTPPGSKAPLEMSISTPFTDTLVLEIDNGDNPPIDLQNLLMFYPVTRILFKAPVEPATYLLYGNRDAGFPQYDLDLIAPRLLAEEKSTATLAAEEELKASAGEHLFTLSGTKNIIFWISLTLVVIVLLVVITRLLPKVEQDKS